MVIATIPPGGKADLDLEFPIFIALGIPPFNTSPASVFLHYTADRVTSIVRGLKAEAERIVAARA